MKEHPEWFKRDEHLIYFGHALGAVKQVRMDKAQLVIAGTE